MAIPIAGGGKGEGTDIEIHGNTVTEMEENQTDVSNETKRRYFTEKEKQNDVIKITNFHIRDRKDEHHEDKAGETSTREEVKDSDSASTKENDKINLHDEKCVRSSHHISPKEEIEIKADLNGKMPRFFVVLTVMMCILANIRTWTNNKLKTRDKHYSKQHVTNHNTKKKTYLEMAELCKSFTKKENWICDMVKTFRFVPKTVVQIFMLNPDEYNKYIEEKKNLRSSMKDAMQFEWCRLASFANYPQNGLSVIRLAEAGFHYQGNGDEVVCYFCGIKHNNWQKTDNPKIIHNQQSPNCPFVLKNLKKADESTSSDNQSTRACGYHEEPTGACGYQTDIKNIPTSSHLSDSRKSPNRPDIPVEEHRQDNNETNEELEMSRNKQTNPQTKGVSNNASQPGENCLSHEGRPTIEFGSFSTNNTTGLIRIPENNNPRSSVSQNPSVTSSNNRQSSSTASNVPTNTFSSAANVEAMSMGVCTEKPKYPRYAVRATRLASFANWPSYLAQTAEELSVAGFFYTGTEDHCRCFYCGGGLRRWEDGDLPWTEHARWYPKCPFVRQCKGDKFVEDVKQGKDPERNNTKNHEEKPKLNGYANSPAVQAILEFGLQPEIIKRAYTSLSQSGIEDITASTLLEKIYEIEESGNQIKSEESGDQIKSPDGDNTKPCSATAEQKQKDEGAANADPELELSFASLEEENRNLKELQTCKICLDDPIAIVFLPCGHMASCVNCAPALRRCPICRTFIKGTVKAIMC